MPSQCPLVEWYRFCGKCTITTCQNHTPRTINGCISLDRHERSDRISDTELLHYKVAPNSDKLDSQSIDVKYTSYIRKKYINNVKNNMVFYLYTLYILQNFKPHPKFGYVAGVSAFIDNLVTTFPFNQTDTVFQPWMLAYAVDPKIFKLFLETQQRASGETVNLIGVLGIPPGKYKNLCQAIKDYSKKLKEKSKQTREKK